MTNVDGLRIVKDNLDVVLIVTCAYAIAAWLVFDHFNQAHVDEHDELGTVDLTRARVVEPDDSCVVTPAHLETPSEAMERSFGITLDPWQREMVNRRLRHRMQNRKVVNG
jgi:hypothetical protein